MNEFFEFFESDQEWMTLEDYCLERDLLLDQAQLIREGQAITRYLRTHFLPGPHIARRSATDLNFRPPPWSNRGIAADTFLVLGIVQTQVTAQGWRGPTPEGRRPQIRGWHAGGSLAVASSTPATPLFAPAKIWELNHA